MGTPARFVQTAYTVPPGGAWFFQIGDDRVAHPVYETALKRADELLKKHGDTRPAARALAEFMCPHMPAWFCAGAVKHSPVIHASDAAKAARPCFSREHFCVKALRVRMLLFCRNTSSAFRSSIGRSPRRRSPAISVQRQNARSLLFSAKTVLSPTVWSDLFYGTR